MQCFRIVHLLIQSASDSSQGAADHDVVQHDGIERLGAARYLLLLLLSSTLHLPAGYQAEGQHRRRKPLRVVLRDVPYDVDEGCLFQKGNTDVIDCCSVRFCQGTRQHGSAYGSAGRLHHTQPRSLHSST